MLQVFRYSIGDGSHQTTWSVLPSTSLSLVQSLPYNETDIQKKHGISPYIRLIFFYPEYLIKREQRMGGMTCDRIYLFRSKISTPSPCNIPGSGIGRYHSISPCLAVHSKRGKCFMQGSCNQTKGYTHMMNVCLLIPDSQTDIGKVANELFTPVYLVNLLFSKR